MSVNGKTVREMGMKVSPGVDDIRVDGDPLVTQEKQKPLYIMLNKPVGYTSTVSDPHADKTVLELLAQITERVYPVGRLDADSDGLLLMTNDGEFANRVTHPRYHVPKLYRVRARGFVDRDAATHLAEGVQLEDGMTAPATVRYIEFDAATQTTLIEITLFEGRNRQVRRMFDLVGHPVRQLTRVGFGTLRLSGLNAGTWRKLKPEEVEELLDLAQPTPTPPKGERRVKPSGPYRPRNAGNIARQTEEANAPAPLPPMPRPAPVVTPFTQSQTLDRLASANNSFVPRNAFVARTPGVPMPVEGQGRNGQDRSGSGSGSGRNAQGRGGGNGGKFGGSGGGRPGRPDGQRPRPGASSAGRGAQGNAPYNNFSNAPREDADGSDASRGSSGSSGSFGAGRPTPAAGSASGANASSGSSYPRPQSKYQTAAPQAVRPATPYERKLLAKAKASRPPLANVPASSAMNGNAPRPNADASRFAPDRSAYGNAPTPRPVYGGGAGPRPTPGGQAAQRPAYGNGNNNTPRPAYGSGNAPRPAYGSGAASRPAFGNGNTPRPAYGSGNPARPAYGNGGAPRPAYGNTPAPRPRPVTGKPAANKPAFGAPPAPAADGSTNNAQGRKAGIPYVPRPKSGHAKFGRAKP